MAIGKVVKVFGLRGEVIVSPMTDNVARYKKLKQVFLGANETGAVEVDVASIHIQPRGVRLKLAHVSDRNAAEAIIGDLLFVKEKDAIRLPKGSFFVHDIIGLTVVDESGNSIGTVNDVLKYPANDIYVIDCNGREVMVPAVKEFIKKIDPETKTMRVKLIDGMLNEPDVVKDE